MNKLVLFAIILTFSSCGMILGLNDAYNQMSRNERALVSKFNESSGLVELDTTGLVYETTATQLRQLMNDPDAYYYVYIWVPWCKASVCKPLSYFEKLRSDLKEQDIHIFLVSDQYVIDEIQQARKRFTYSGRIYVMDHAVYGGQGRGKQTRAFLGELTGANPVTDSMAFSKYFLFKSDSLVGYSINSDQIVADHLSNRWQQ